MNHHVESLCRQHDELRALAGVYEQELGRAAPDFPALARCRWTLTRLVLAHLAYERLYLYGTLSRWGDTTGLKLGEQLNELGDRLDAHVRNWTPKMIENDWLSYVAASRQLIQLLSRQMELEEKTLYPRLLLAKAA